MVFVNNAGSSWDWIEHAAWDGIHLADFVMPFFLFIVGMSISLSMSKMVEQRTVPKKEILKKIIERTLKLFFLGLFMTSIRFRYDLSRIRIPGVLQRIAVDYFVVSITMLFAPTVDMTKFDDYFGNHIQNEKLCRLAEFLFGSKGLFSVFIRYIITWSVAIVIYLIYLSLLFLPSIPGCGRGSLGANCNAAGYIDVLILTPNHMYGHPTCKEAAPPCEHFDPEGIVSTISSTASCFIGLYMGYVLAKFSEHKHRISHWIVSGIIMVVLSIIIHFSGVPYNKNLYSISYVTLMAGSASIIYALSYAVIDIPQTRIIRILLLPSIALGMNSIAVYAFDFFWFSIWGRPGGSAYLYWDKPDQNIVNWTFQHLYMLMPIKTAVFFWGLTDVFICMIFAGVLYKLGIFFKI
jgi:heparan-alpha-glucosaminide N-acetyltransferase